MRLVIISFTRKPNTGRTSWSFHSRLSQAVCPNLHRATCDTGWLISGMKNTASGGLGKMTYGTGTTMRTEILNSSCFAWELLRSHCAYQQCLIGLCFHWPLTLCWQLWERGNCYFNNVCQQFIKRQKFGWVRFLHRYQSEKGGSKNRKFMLRFMGFSALSTSLSKCDRVDSKVHLRTCYETFLNDQEIVFKSDRWYFGLGYELISVVRFEVGYMVQMFSNSSRDQINLITFVNF